MSTLNDLEVHVTTAFSHFYGAVLFVDHVKTDFDCGHNRRRPENASKCLRPVLAWAQDLAGRSPDEYEMVSGDGDRMVEFRYRETVQSRFTGTAEVEHRCRISFLGQEPVRS